MLHNKIRMHPRFLNVTGRGVDSMQRVWAVVQTRLGGLGRLMSPTVDNEQIEESSDETQHEQDESDDYESVGKRQASESL